MLPYTLELLIDDLPKIISHESEGQIFWAAVFSVLVFFVSLPRTLSALRFTSFGSFIISFFIILSIVFIGFVNRTVTPDLGASFQRAAKNFDISILGVFNSLPLVIFAYMYQTNIPMIYAELEKKTPKERQKAMWKILLFGTLGATICYVLAGMLGYVTFA